MHGSSFVGDGAAALRAGADVMERYMGAPRTTLTVG